jgi:hypothetical protein
MRIAPWKTGSAPVSAAYQALARHSVWIVQRKPPGPGRRQQRAPTRPLACPLSLPATRAIDSQDTGTVTRSARKAAMPPDTPPAFTRHAGLAWRGLRDPVLLGAFLLVALVPPDAWAARARKRGVLVWHPDLFPLSGRASLVSPPPRSHALLLRRHSGPRPRRAASLPGRR